MKNRNSFFHYFSFPAGAGDLYGMFASIQLIKKHKRLASAGKTLKEMNFHFIKQCPARTSLSLLFIIRNMSSNLLGILSYLLLLQWIPWWNMRNSGRISAIVLKISDVNVLWWDMVGMGVWRYWLSGSQCVIAWED